MGERKSAKAINEATESFAKKCEAKFQTWRTELANTRRIGELEATVNRLHKEFEVRGRATVRSMILQSVCAAGEMKSMAQAAPRPDRLAGRGRGMSRIIPIQRSPRGRPVPCSAVECQDGRS